MLIWLLVVHRKRDDAAHVDVNVGAVLYIKCKLATD